MWELFYDTLNNTDKVGSDLDWKIEQKVLSLYGIAEEDRGRIWNELKKLARLRIVRELLPDDTEGES